MNNDTITDKQLNAIRVLHAIANPARFDIVNHSAETPIADVIAALKVLDELVGYQQRHEELFTHRECDPSEADCRPGTVHFSYEDSPVRGWVALRTFEGGAE